MKPYRRYVPKYRLWVGGFYVDTFAAPVHLLWPARDEVAREYIRARWGWTVAAMQSALGVCYSFGEGENEQFVIALREWEGTVDDLRLLSHECFHVACGILRSCEIPQTEDTEEVSAYLQQSITRRATRILNGQALP